MFRLTIEDVFAIRGRGTVATGRVESGRLRVGDEVRVIEAFRKQLDEANAGDTVGIVFVSLARSQVNRGDVLTAVVTVV